jgi:hypothetical protein
MHLQSGTTGLIQLYGTLELYQHHLTDVFSNNFTVQVNGTFTVLSVRNTASAPIVAGGTLT